MKVRNNISSNFGIGFSMADSMLTQMGYKPEVKKKYVVSSFTRWIFVRDLISENEHNLGNSLKKKIKDNIKAHISKKDYIGFCFRNGYPTKGQRRRTNGSTAKKLHKY